MVSRIQKNPPLCSYSTSSVSMAKIAGIVEQASICHYDELWLQVLLQASWEVWSSVFESHIIWRVGDNRQIWVHLWMEEKSSTSRLLGTGISMDANMMIVKCFANCVWTHLFKLLSVLMSWNLSYCWDFSWRSASKSIFPLCRGNKQVHGRFWGTSSTTTVLMDNNGWIEVVFATGRKCWDTGEILQQLDAQPLCSLHFLFLSWRNNSNCFFNVPGSVLDSQVLELGWIYHKLEHVYETTGGMCCINSAFGNVERNYLYKSSQDLLGYSVPTRCERNIGRQLRWQTTSV